MKQCLMCKIILCLALTMFAFTGYAAAPEPASKTTSTVERPVDLQFNNVPLGDALEALFKGTGKNYTLDPGLQQLRVIAVLKNVSFDTAVSGLLKAAGATYYVDEKGIYHISYPQQILQQQAPMSLGAAPAPPAPVAAGGVTTNYNYQNQQMKSQAVNTNYIDPGQIAGVLRATPGVSQIETTNGRQVIVSGTDEGIANATKAIQVLDNANALPRSVRLKMSARVTVGTKLGPKTYEATTESVGAEQMPSLLNLDAQTGYGNYTMANKNARQVQANPARMSLVNATVTPSFVADKIALIGKGHFSCPFGSVPGTELSKDFDIAASLTPGKPFTVAAGSVNMIFGNVDFSVSMTATPEQGRLPSFQNTYQPNVWNNAAPPPTSASPAVAPPASAPAGGTH